jgi:hypothetical protein
VTCSLCKRHIEKWENYTSETLYRELRSTQRYTCGACAANATLYRVGDLTYSDFADVITRVDVLYKRDSTSPVMVEVSEDAGASWRFMGGFGAALAAVKAKAVAA